jgi:CRP-like cAMP-binding protein
VSQSPNLILNALPQNIFAALQSHLKAVELVFGTVVAEPEKPINHVYFPHLGVISLVVEMEDGDMIETAMVGRDGVVNGTAALDGKVSLHLGVVQVAGSASTVDPDVLRAMAVEFEPLHSLLIRHEQVLFAQAQQSAGCNASHSVEARLARWLLRMRDLAQSDSFYLTQDFLAHMLGVRRPSVSLVAAAFQRAGFLVYRRGHMKILDVEGLHSSSCECYEKVKAHYARLSLR